MGAPWLRLDSCVFEDGSVRDAGWLGAVAWLGVLTLAKRRAVTSRDTSGTPTTRPTWTLESSPSCASGFSHATGIVT